MRIAIDARYMRSEFSGIGEYSENLVEALAREDRENEYVVFVHSSYHGNPEIGGNFTLVPERARPVSSLIVEAGIRVAHMGSSSVRYEVGLFAQGAPLTAARGHFVHVYVDRATQRPVPLPEPLRQVLQALR